MDCVYEEVHVLFMSLAWYCTLRMSYKPYAVVDQFLTYTVQKVDNVISWIIATL